jgi:hypothetical protein
MDKIPLITSFGIISCLMGSCSILPWLGNADLNEVKAQQAQAERAIESKTQQKVENILKTKPESQIQVTGLIPATNPDKRVASIIKGRQDPFAPIPINPIIKAKPISTKLALKTPTQVNEVPEVKSLPSKLTVKNPPSRPTIKKVVEKPLIQNHRGKRPVEIATVPTIPNIPDRPPSKTIGIKPDTPPLSVPDIIPTTNNTKPPAPTPDLAQATVVTGIIDVGGVVKAIVKEPNETSSRYVAVGDYLSGGNVLFKRVEFDNTVVLEERGIEVYKKIGEVPGS